MRDILVDVCWGLDAIMSRFSLGNCQYYIL